MIVRKKIVKRKRNDCAIYHKLLCMSISWREKAEMFVTVCEKKEKKKPVQRPNTTKTFVSYEAQASALRHCPFK